MEPSVLCSPYLKATSRDSVAIREMLDREENEYVAWRSNRKSIRHPFASIKLNSPQKALPQDRHQVSAKPLWLALLEPTQVFEVQGTRSRATSSSGHGNGTNSRRPTGGASAKNLSTASTPQLPSLPRSQDRLPTAASLVSFQTRHGTASPPSRKKPSAAKRRLQKNLYDFHSNIVFSIAAGEKNASLYPDEPALPPVVGPCSSRVEPLGSSRQPDVAIIELPAPEPEDPYVLSGLGVVGVSCFDDIFETDWANSEVDRIVRDAVERKRIKLILQRWYRVLLLYFRQYAGKSTLATTSTSSQYFATDLQQIPNRLSILEDLNVQCVDPAKYGLSETPLHRDGLIKFIMHAAKMVAMHSPKQAEFRMFAAEGIEMSEAVRSLMVDHLGVYAQIQDATHFRDVFLLDHHDRQGRLLRHILSKYEGSLSSFFFESIVMTKTASLMTTNGLRGRSDSHRGDQLQAQTTMSFHAFVTVLKMLNVIPATVGTQRRTGASDEAPTKTGVVMLDENRAMRIFQQCLDVMAELCGTMHAKHQLTYPQFIEALLRVTLIRNETTICRGGFDICPGQQTCHVCQCRYQLPPYDFSAFDDAIEAFFMFIQAQRLRQSNRRSSVKMESIQLLQLNGQKARQRQPAVVVVNPDANASQQEDSENDHI